MSQPLPPGPTYAAPPKPEVPLGRALAWTCAFSFLGAIVVVTALALVVLVALLLILGVVAAIADSVSMHDVLADLSLSDVAGVGLGFGLVFLGAGVASTVLSAGMLLLLRLVREFRTWKAVLQGLSAAGATYVGGWTLFTIVSRVHDLFAR